MLINIKLNSPCYCEFHVPIDFPGGGNAEYVSVYEDHAIRIPDSIDFTTAAAIPEVWLTAYQLLHIEGRLKAGETVLIHAGGSGVGTSAVQLVKLAGATPIVTAGSTEKIDLAKSLGAAHGFNYKEGSFSEKVLEATNGRGVDLIIDCVGGSYWEQNLAAIAIEGRWILYGLLGGNRVDGEILGKILMKRMSLIGSTLRARSKEYKTNLIGSFGETAVPHFATGELKPIIDTVFPSLNKLPDAHRLMESNANAGKIVLTVRQEDSKKEEL